MIAFLLATAPQTSVREQVIKSWMGAKARKVISRSVTNSIVLQ